MLVRELSKKIWNISSGWFTQGYVLHNLPTVLCIIWQYILYTFWSSFVWPFWGLLTSFGHNPFWYTGPNPCQKFLPFWQKIAHCIWVLIQLTGWIFIWQVFNYNSWILKVSSLIICILISIIVSNIVTKFEKPSLIFYASDSIFCVHRCWNLQNFPILSISNLC